MSIADDGDSKKASGRTSDRIVISVVTSLLTAGAIWGAGKLGAFAYIVFEPAVPASAVIAFNGECPPGWDKFDIASGRFLVAAGTGQDANGKLETFELGPNVKGEYVHRLSIDEMPSHNHGFKKQIAGVPTFVGVAVGVPSSKTDNNFVNAFLDADFNQGEGDAHNNIPPYIALNFCVKS